MGKTGIYKSVKQKNHNLNTKHIDFKLKRFVMCDLAVYILAAFLT